MGSQIEAVVKPHSASPQHDEERLKIFLTDMAQRMTTVVNNLAKAARDAGGQQVVPIITVAYDFPIPDGRNFMFGFCPWLQPVFARQQYFDPDAQGGGDSTRLMAMFIRRLNDTYARVASDLSQQGVLVRHVPLTGQLGQLQTDHKLRFDQVWKNELHPTKVGFAALAQHLHQGALTPLFTA